MRPKKPTPKNAITKEAIDIILDNSMSFALEEGSKVVFGCTAQGFPKPQVHWVLKSKPGKILSKVPALILNQVEPEHAGEYLCVATNSEGRSEDGLQIIVFCELNLQNFHNFYSVFCR